MNWLSNVWNGSILWVIIFSLPVFGCVQTCIMIPIGSCPYVLCLGSFKSPNVLQTSSGTYDDDHDQYLKFEWNVKKWQLRTGYVEAKSRLIMTHS